MSSERAGVPTHDKWQVVYEYDSFEDAEGAYVGAERPYDRALPGSPTIRRASGHTSRALNREQARELLIGWNAPDLAHTHEDGFLDALEACVVPDPRITRIETEVYGTEKPQNLEAALHMVERVRAILRGDQ